MKKLLLIPGIILCLAAIARGGKYLMDYQILSQFGKGYVWGNILMLVLGITCLYFALRKKRTPTR